MRGKSLLVLKNRFRPAELATGKQCKKCFTFIVNEFKRKKQKKFKVERSLTVCTQRMADQMDVFDGI